MKKLLFLIVFLGINILTFGSNVYFLTSGKGYVYTNGQPFNSNQYVAYHLWADPYKYTIDEWGASFQDTDGNWSDWSKLSGSQGLHECLKAGTWHVKGRVHVKRDIFGYSNYWMYTSFTLYFYVVDNNAPSAPQNLSVTISNNNPALSWNPNSEDDMGGYNIYRKRMGEQSHSKINSSLITTTSYIDTEINATFSGGAVVEYYVTAVDMNANESSNSNNISIGENMRKRNSVDEEDAPITYNLSSAYPNPFNPTTQISYQIPKASNVTLIVYNMLGKEVVELVNESKSAGVYNVSFNASNLPSGLYLYKIQAGEFTEVRKMLLMK